MRYAVPALALAAWGACASKQSGFADIYFSNWDSRRVFCGLGADSTHTWSISDLYTAVDRTVERREVLHTYGHAPGFDLSEFLPVFQYAHERGVEFVTYSDLVDRSHPRAAWAFSIDDHEVDTWLTWRDPLRAAGAVFTFFVSNWDSLTPMQIAGLTALASDGHDIEAHGLNHMDASTYADGGEAYYEREVAPEIAKLEAAGFPISTFAYPFGARSASADTAILRSVPIIRVALTHWCYGADPIGPK